MGRGSKDHFVPCGYLRHFVTEDSKVKNPDPAEYRKWRIYAYNRIKDEEIHNPVRIDSVANLRLFEHFEGNKNVNTVIRREIRQIENSFFHVQSGVVEKKSMNGFMGQMSTIIDFVAFQRERTKFRRELYKKRLQSAISNDSSAQKLSETGSQKVEEIVSLLPEVQEVLKERLGLDDPLDIQRFEQAFLRLQNDAVSGELHERVASHLTEIVQKEAVLQNFHLRNCFRYAVDFSNQLKNCSWVMFRNKTKQPFWTSDNPVATFLNPLFSQNEPEWLEGVFDDLKILSGIINSSNPLNEDGSANKDFCLLFPVGSQIIFQVEAYDARVGFRYGEADIEDESHIHKLNFYQFACTSRTIYSSNKSFDLIPDMRRYIRDTFDKAQNFPDKLQEIIDGIKVKR